MAMHKSIFCHEWIASKLEICSFLCTQKRRYACGYGGEWANFLQINFILSLCELFVSLLFFLLRTALKGINTSFIYDDDFLDITRVLVTATATTTTVSTVISMAAAATTIAILTKSNNETTTITTHKLRTESVKTKKFAFCLRGIGANIAPHCKWIEWMNPKQQFCRSMPHRKYNTKSTPCSDLHPVAHLCGIKERSNSNNSQTNTHTHAHREHYLMVVVKIK